MQLPATSTGSPMINYRKDAKKAVKFTFMVAGELGTGKTTFINCLLDRRIMPHVYEGVPGSDTKTLSFTLAHAVALSSTSVMRHSKFNAAAAGDEPGIALTETTVEVLDDDNVRLNLHIIDTPGFGDNLDNELCFVEIENYLKQQFDSVLAEETRIRRNPRFVDTRVHALLYFITPTGHGLREMDINCMKRLAKYVNIVPVIARADSFTERKLKYFKRQISTDIERFNVPTFKFDTYLDNYDEDDDSELIQECKFLTKLQPFAVVASEHSFEIKDTATGETKTIKARQYPWGLVDINNPKYSDFPILRSVLLGSHLQDLKDLTHDFLYETYRTERLSEVTGKDGDTFRVTPCVLGEAGSQEFLETVPSLSNLAQLTASDTLMRLEFSTANDAKNNSNYSNDTNSLLASPQKNPRQMLYNDDDSTVNGADGDGKLLVHRDTESVVSLKLAYLARSGLLLRGMESSDKKFKRMSIAPQRTQVRRISQTVPYVIRHERILERQQKLEEMELVNAKELESRAAQLKQKAAQLKARERMLLEQMKQHKQAETGKGDLRMDKAGEEGESGHSADHRRNKDQSSLHRRQP